MADEEPLITIGAYLDKDNDPIAVIVIAGVTYARLEGSLAEAVATSQATCKALEQYRDAKKLREVTVDNTTERDPSKEN